ncbi:MAG: glycosyltransferase [Sporichthyaceae bacterium]
MSTPGEIVVVVRGDRSHPADTATFAEAASVADVAELKAAGAKREWARITVLADSLAHLRGALPQLRRAGKAHAVSIIVARTDRLREFGLPTGIEPQRVVAARSTPYGASGIRLDVEFDQPASAGAVCAEIFARASVSRTGSTAGLRLGLTDAQVLPWGAGDSAARMIGPRTALVKDITGPVVDLLVGPVLPSSDGPGPIPYLTLTERFALPPVDLAVTSPTGFRVHVEGGDGTLRIDGGNSTTGATFEIRDGQGARVGGGDLRAGLSENDLGVLRSLRSVQVEGEDHFALGRILTQLACAGVPTRRCAVPDLIAAALGPELTQRLVGGLGDAADPGARESWSVQTRRIALSRFGAPTYWAAAAADAGLRVRAQPTVSVLLATRRADFLAFALAQIARQDWPQVQTVLVLHGVAAAAPQVRTVIEAFDRPLTVVEVGADVIFGTALQLGLDRCAGELVTKMDDDDWYGAHHLRDLVQAHSYSGASCVGLADHHLYLHGSEVTMHSNPRGTEAYVRWLAGPTMLMATAELRSLGGWRPVPRAVDWHLISDLRAAGGSMYAIHDLGFLYYRGVDHTWTAPTGDRYWLDSELEQRPGLHAPPQLDLLPHPRMR